MTAQQKHTIRKTLSLMALSFAVTFALVVMVESIGIFDSANAQLQQPDAPMLSPEIDTDWRYTNQGWLQIGELYRASFAPLRTFESIHPFVWAASVMMAVIASTVWASSEWEFARLWKQPD